MLIVLCFTSIWIITPVFAVFDNRIMLSHHRMATLKTPTFFSLIHSSENVVSKKITQAQRQRSSRSLLKYEHPLLISSRLRRTSSISSDENFFLDSQKISIPMRRKSLPLIYGGSAVDLRRTSVVPQYQERLAPNTDVLPAPKPTLLMNYNSFPSEYRGSLLPMFKAFVENEAAFSPLLAVRDRERPSSYFAWNNIPPKFENSKRSWYVPDVHPIYEMDNYTLRRRLEPMHRHEPVTAIPVQLVKIHGDPFLIKNTTRKRPAGVLQAKLNTSSSPAPPFTFRSKIKNPCRILPCTSQIDIDTLPFVYTSTTPASHVSPVLTHVAQFEKVSVIPFKTLSDPPNKKAQEKVSSVKNTILEPVSVLPPLKIILSKTNNENVFPSSGTNITYFSPSEPLQDNNTAFPSNRKTILHPVEKGALAPSLQRLFLPQEYGQSSIKFPKISRPPDNLTILQNYDDIVSLLKNISTVSATILSPRQKASLMVSLKKLLTSLLSETDRFPSSRNKVKPYSTPAHKKLVIRPSVESNRSSWTRVDNILNPTEKASLLEWLKKFLKTERLSSKQSLNHAARPEHGTISPNYDVATVTLQFERVSPLLKTKKVMTEIEKCALTQSFDTCLQLQFNTPQHPQYTNENKHLIKNEGYPRKILARPSDITANKMFTGPSKFLPEKVLPHISDLTPFTNHLERPSHYPGKFWSDPRYTSMMREILFSQALDDETFDSNQIHASTSLYHDNWSQSTTYEPFDATERATEEPMERNISAFRKIFNFDDTPKPNLLTNTTHELLTKPLKLCVIPNNKSDLQPTRTKPPPLHRAITTAIKDKVFFKPPILQPPDATLLNYTKVSSSPLPNITWPPPMTKEMMKATLPTSKDPSLVPWKIAKLLYYRCKPIYYDMYPWDFPEAAAVYHHRGKFLDPDTSKGRMRIEYGFPVTVLCSGDTNSIKLQGRAIYKKSMDIYWAGERSFVSADHRWDGSFTRITCKARPVPSTEYTGTRCGLRGHIINVGFKVEEEVLPLYTVCFDNVTLATEYATHTLGPASHFANCDKTPNTLGADYYEGIPIRKLLSDKYIEQRFGTLLGSQMISVYLSNKRFLTMSLLVPKADFLFDPYQRATLFFINTAPIWTTVYSGNWETLDTSIRSLASSTGRTLRVFTGTHGVSDLSDGEGTSRDIYLYENVDKAQVIPVPFYLYKVLYDPDSFAGIAFVTINNPYYSPILVRDLTFCQDLCRKHILDWLDWTPNNVVAGYSFCCTIADFNNTVGTLPHLSSETSVNGQMA